MVVNEEPVPALAPWGVRSKERYVSHRALPGLNIALAESRISRIITDDCLVQALHQATVSSRVNFPCLRIQISDDLVWQIEPRKSV